MKHLITIAIISMLGAPAAADSVHTKISEHLDATYPVTEKQVQIQIALLNNSKYHNKLFGDFTLGSNAHNLAYDEYIVTKAYKANKIDIFENAKNLSPDFTANDQARIYGACIIPGSPATILSLLPTSPIPSKEVVKIKNTFEKLALLYGVLLDTMSDNEVEFKNGSFINRNYFEGKLLAGADGNSDRKCFTKYGKKRTAQEIFGYIYGAASFERWQFPRVARNNTFLNENEFSKVQLDLYYTAAKFIEKYDPFFATYVSSQEIEVKMNNMEEDDDLGAILENDLSTNDEASDELKLENLDF